MKSLIPDTQYTAKGLLGIINALPLVIIVVDESRSIRLANEHACRFAGYSREHQMLGKTGGECFRCVKYYDSPEGCGSGPACKKCRLCETLKKSLEDRKPRYGVEEKMTFQHLGKRDLRFSSLPVLMDDRDAILLVIEDITELKKLEKAQIEKEKLSAVIQTAGAVCHKINQPLMCILGFSDLLLDDLPPDSRQVENLKEIKRQVKELGRITDKLMKITKYTTQEYLGTEIIDIDEASDRTRQERHPKKKEKKVGKKKNTGR